MTREELVKNYEKLSFGKKAGIGRLVTEEMHDEVYECLSKLNSDPITKVQLNQLLVISKCGSISDGYFQYYWKKIPKHPYDVTKVEFYNSKWTTSDSQQIVAHNHLKWGLYRVAIDGLLYFGNVTAGFNSLRSMSYDNLSRFFEQKRFDSDAISARGPALPLRQITKDDRYLISEMACKTFGDVPEDSEVARELLQNALTKHYEAGGKEITFKELLNNAIIEKTNPEQHMQYTLAFDDVLEDELETNADLAGKFDGLLEKFYEARKKASENTDLYLSMVNDLDVYVATSMRTRKNFRDMATACETIFGDKKVEHLHLRYFDPTLSAARGHEDKGLIECLMVKCAKVLVYCEGEKESYGKDAEAAMALSLGKPVIFFCDHGKKTNFYRDVHPLSRLIDFRTGVAVGAIVTDQVDQVAELLKRIFENTMEYKIEHHAKRPGYLKLIEKLTDSVVRLQTDDELLTSTFWNNYHNRQRDGFISLAAGKEAERLQE